MNEAELYPATTGIEHGMSILNDRVFSSGVVRHQAGVALPALVTDIDDPFLCDICYGYCGRFAYRKMPHLCTHLLEPIPYPTCGVGVPLQLHYNIGSALCKALGSEETREDEAQRLREESPVCLDLGAFSRNRVRTEFFI